LIVAGVCCGRAIKPLAVPFRPEPCSAAGLLLAILVGYTLPVRWQGFALRLLLAVGFGVFLLVAAATLLTPAIP
jgi:hypothetical protein